MAESLSCPICRAPSCLLDVVDFNKSCEEARGKFLPLSGVPVYYAACDICRFAYAPELRKWSLDEFASKIYNDSYIEVDPDYLKLRPENNAKCLVSMFGTAPKCKHLDYGGGSGLLCSLLVNNGWNSMSYDPFVDKTVQLNQLGKFDLITAFEVFEHVPDVQDLMRKLRALLSHNGIVLFSTLLSDGNIERDKRMSWWYASPRNGHISLFSKISLSLLAAQHQLKFGSFSPGFHAFFRTIPSWANGILSAS